MLPWHFYRVFGRVAFASRTSKNRSSRPVRLRATARQRCAPPRRRRRARTQALCGLCLLQSGAAACARKHRRLCDPRARGRRDAEGQPQPAASTERGRPLLKRGQCGTALPRRRAPHRDAAGQPCRPPSTSRTNLRHRRAPQRKTRRRRRRRSRVSVASILRPTRPWRPIAITATCTTRPSAPRWPRRSP